MYRQVLVTVVAVAVLSACSNDGGDDEPPPPPPPPPPTSGLDERPSNTACLAPARDSISANLAAPAAFPALTFDAPVAMLQAPGDASRWFVVEQGGLIRAFANDEAVPATSDFLDMRARVHLGRETGLLGLAFHPDFAANGRAFVNYVARSGGVFRSVTSEFTSPDGGLTLDPNSERVLLTVEKDAANHNGGHLAFGPDGFLYLGLGDGGGAGDPQGNAQNPMRLLGKMLRIDVDTQPGGAPYGIPDGATGNPFAGNALCNADGSGTEPCPEIYALGFRNPWRWSFDAATGALWVADVGQSAYEEIDVVERGGNYGWDIREAGHCFEPATGCATAGLIDPVAEYGRGLGFSITGGYVYRGAQDPAPAGQYVFADFVSGLVGSLVPDGGGGYVIGQLVAPGATPADAPGPLAISAFGQGVDGELYALDYERGGIRRLVFTEGGGSDNVPDLLSETGCVDMSAPGAPPLASLIPYGLNAPFWSDGASKDRWLGLPDGGNILVPDDGDWDFPEATVFVKHFHVGEQLAETRLFMRHPDGGWAGYTYRWNDAQTEATRVRGGLVAPVAGQDWIYPSEAECMFCHNKSAGYTLGLETAQLNGDHTYPQTGRTSNQIATLNAIDALTPPIAGDPPAYADPADDSQPIEARARVYLHANCSFCHRPGGPTPALIDLRHGTALADTGACDVPPTIDDLGIPDARIIAPGDPERSELLSRMSRRDFAGMPPVASGIPDAEGVALIRAWIDSLTPADCQ
jgi:uncharacterized repeat protein (TIGR03806 family)